MFLSEVPPHCYPVSSLQWQFRIFRSLLLGFLPPETHPPIRTPAAQVDRLSLKLHAWEYPQLFRYIVPWGEEAIQFFLFSTTQTPSVMRQYCWKMTSRWYSPRLLQVRLLSQTVLRIPCNLFSPVPVIMHKWVIQPTFKKPTTSQAFSQHWILETWCMLLPLNPIKLSKASFLIVNLTNRKANINRWLPLT